MMGMRGEMRMSLGRNIGGLAVISCVACTDNLIGIETGDDDGQVGTTIVTAGQATANASLSLGGSFDAEGEVGPSATATTGAASSSDPSLGDVDAGSDTGSSAPCPVDVLFVIDNSPSMIDEHRRIVTGFPAFMRSLGADPIAEDYRVMVIDTDIRPLGGAVTCDAGHCTCRPAGECCPRLCYNSPERLSCNGVACDDTPPPECEFMLGAGRRVRNSTGEACRFVGGGSVLGVADPIEAAFACAADVGTGGSTIEQVMPAMQAAFDPFDMAASCNVGFRRPGVPLVIIFASDEDHEEEDGSTPAHWYRDLAAQLGPDITRTIMIGLIGDLDTEAPICSPATNVGDQEAAAAPQYREFIGLFGARGIAGSICADDYQSYLRAMVPAVHAACGIE